MPFLIIFVVVPLLEVAAFAKIGAAIGVFNTLFFCVLTAAVGGWIVRRQGLATLFKARSNLRDGRLPLNELFEGLCIVIAGALLLTPGFVTDFIGFALLIPLLRRGLKAIIDKYGLFSVAPGVDGASARPFSRDDVIEGEYESVQNIKPELNRGKDR